MPTVAAMVNFHNMQTLHEEEQETSELLTQLNRAVQLPVWLVYMLKNPPARGEGLHRWLYKVALQLHPHLVPAIQAPP